MSKSQKLIDDLDDLIASSETAASPEESYKHLVSAIQKTCAAMRGFVRDLEEIAADVLKLHGLDDPEAALPFHDQVSGNASLAHFNSPQALTAFLSAARPLLVIQLNGSEIAADRFTEEILRSYTSFIDQKITVSNLVDQSKRLKLLFCRPPEGGSGTGTVPGTPPLLPNGSGTKKDRQDLVIRWITAAATIIIAGTAVFGIFALADNKKAEKQESLTSLGLLTLLTMAGFVGEIDSRGELPALVP